MFQCWIFCNRVPVKSDRLSWRMGSLILFQLLSAHFVLRLGGIVTERGQFAMNFGRAEVRRILKRDSAQAERFIRNRKSEFTRSGLLTHRKSVLASSGIYFKSQILHVDLIGFHQAPLSQQNTNGFQGFNFDFLDLCSSALSRSSSGPVAIAFLSRSRR